MIVGVVKLSVMLWATDKGFDLGDEGLYMLALAEPDRYRVIAHGYVLNQLLPFDPFTIPVSRTISIVLELLGGLVFSMGIVNWSKHQLPKQIPFLFIWAFVLLASFQSILARCVSYNDIAYFLGLCAGGTLLFSWGKKPIPYWLLKVLSATCIGLAFIFKAPVTISLSVLFLGYSTLMGERSNLVNFFQSLLSLIVGFMVAAGLLTILYKGTDWWTVVTSVKETADLLNYSPLGLLGMYLIYDGTPNLVFLVLGLVSFGVSNALFSRFNLSDAMVFVLSATLTTVIGAVCIHRFEVLLIPEERPVYLFLWMVMLSIGYLLFRVNLRSHVQPWITIIFLLLIPLAIIGGTNGYITESLFSFWIPWFAVIAVALHLLQEDLPKLRYQFITGILIVAVAIQFIYSKVLNPFGMPKHTWLAQQSHPIPGPDGLKVDAFTKGYFETFYNALDKANVQPADPIIGLNYMPGLVYLAKGYSPAAPFFVYDAFFDNYNCHFINKINVKPKAILLRSTVTDVTMDCVRERFPEFPKQYKLIKFEDPYATVYEYEEPGDGLLYFYYPR